MDVQHATTLEAIADTIPDEPALIQGDRVVSWREFDDRAARLAGALVAAGLQPGSKVAIDLYNANEWAETYLGALKARCVPVSINYRYLDDELRYLLENADAEAIVFHAGLGERPAAVARTVAGMKLLLRVDDLALRGEVAPPLPEGVVDYEQTLATTAPMPRIERSPEDGVMVFTGGTTGLPKGVLGRATGSFSGLQTTRLVSLGRFDDPPSSMPLDIVEGVRALHARGDRVVAVPCSPLMHSTAVAYAMMNTFYCGGTMVTLTGRSFDAHELLRTIDRRRVTSITIVGDAFARPMVNALEEARAAGTPYDGSSLRVIWSAGVLFSADVKERLLEHLPGVAIYDSCGTAEGVQYGWMLHRKGDVAESTRFRAADGVKVIDEHDRPMEPGTGKPGLLAAIARTRGYFKDEAKTAETFRMIDGVRHVIPGDYGLLHEDGTITLLGRGSTVVNTGGEKVHPEEVEAVIKTIPEVDDCIVLGVPDERLGQRVAALVQLRAGTTLDASVVTEVCRARLAGYKAPRAVVFTDRVPRFPNGKPDYPSARALAEP